MRIEIKNLSKTYGSGVRALKGVDFSICSGMFGLIGQNGVGKSPLMRTIATLQDTDEDSINFGDIDVAKEPSELCKVCWAYLQQEFVLYLSAMAEARLDKGAVAGRVMCNRNKGLLS